MNKVVIIGNLTRDTELSVTNGGTTVCKFGIAVSRQSKEEVDFFNIVVFSKQAENCNKFIKKGSKVAISGRLQSSSYKDKDGKATTRIDIIAEEVQFLDSKPKESMENLTPVDEDVPF